MTKKHEEAVEPVDSSPVPGGRDVSQDSPDIAVEPKDTPPTPQ